MEINEERAALMASEVGKAVFDLRFKGEDITLDNILEYMQWERSKAGNVIRKGVLRDAITLLKMKGSS